ncbi:MAG: aminotransferase class V-fold PLP-dependent enzyme [Gemmatimonadota bacterium]|nr:MAG: aminotransferase class V-fold PLP-dependent enzyme [Gemmatimonadota bacterium]
MSHRRTFMKQLASLTGAASLGTLSAVDQAFAAELSGLPDLVTGSLASLRDRYLLDPDVTYFNHGSIGTTPRIVHEARAAYLRTCETNPWLYMWGDAWEEPLEQVRQKAAGLLRCEATELALTHNTTEGFNTLAAGLDLGPGDEVLFSSLNHPGASICWNHYAEIKGFQVRRFDFPVLEMPRLTAADVLDAYDRAIAPRTRVLVFPHIDNIVGLRYPVKELAALARSRGVELIAVDGAQSVGMIDVNLNELGVDAYCASPHKWLQAPKGLGLMYVREDVQRQIRPMWVTWGQERWKGSARMFEDYGTRNLPEVLTLGDAIDFQESLGAPAKERRYRELWELFRAAGESSGTVIWRSPTDWSLSASLYALEIEDIPSQAVFEHMYGLHKFVFRPFRTQGLNTVRISLNITNTEAEIARFFELLKDVPQH